MIHKGRRERVKKRFLLEGLASFSDHEVLELLLFYAIPQKDTNELAHQLIHIFGNLHGVLEADIQDLCAVDGVGENIAILLKLTLPLYKSYLKSKLAKKAKLSNLQSLHNFLIFLFLNESVEKFYVICLNHNFEVVGQKLLATGTHKEVSVHPKLIAEIALKHRATQVVLAHNHISNNVTPSPADIETTQYVEKLLSMLDITLCDHIIVSNTTLRSIKNNENFSYSFEDLE